MEHIKAEQVLCDEELRPEPITEESEQLKATKLFRENMRLAVHIASKYKLSSSSRVSEEDIYQTALLALWEAALRYDKDSGIKFNYYASPWIDGRIKTMLRGDNPLKMSRSITDIRYILYTHNFQLPLTEEEIDIIVSEGVVTRKQLEMYSEPSMISIDMKIRGNKEDSRRLIADIIPDNRAIVGEDFTDDEIEDIITDILKYIKPGQRSLIEEWLYSVVAGEDTIQATLAKKYNISQSYVSRVIKGAKKLLQSYDKDIKYLFGID